MNPELGTCSARPHWRAAHCAALSNRVLSWPRSLQRHSYTMLSDRTARPAAQSPGRPSCTPTGTPLCEQVVHRTPGNTETLGDRRGTQLSPSSLDLRRVDLSQQVNGSPRRPPLGADFGPHGCAKCPVKKAHPGGDGAAVCSGLQLRREVLGERHPNTIASLNNLAGFP
jgi:hypothetical protein